MVLNYRYRDTLCATIQLDSDTKSVSVKNFAEDVFYRPFGVIRNPSFKDFEELLEERCFPRTNHHAKYYLKQLGLDFYDPLDIVRKTNGKVYGDKFWIEFVGNCTLQSLHNNVSVTGNQAKFYDSVTDGWYKADYLGYEGLSEYVVLDLLKHSMILNPNLQFVLYDICSFKIGNKQLIGCYSKNFIKETEADLTLFRFFKMYYGIDITMKMLGMSSKKQIKYVVDSVESVTRLSNFGAFLTLLLELDAFVLNDDRHFKNISIIKYDNGGFGLAPIFDNAGSLLSDEYTYSGSNLERLIEVVESKPFSCNFDEQLDAAEELYGVQIKFPNSVRFLEEIKPKILKYYNIEQFKRVEYVLRHSIRKYSYLAKNPYEELKQRK